MNSPYVGRPEIRYRFCSNIFFLSPFYVKYDRERACVMLANDIAIPPLCVGAVDAVASIWLFLEQLVRSTAIQFLFLLHLEALARA